MRIDIQVDHGSQIHRLHPHGGHFGRHPEFNGVPEKIEPNNIEILIQDIKTRRSSHHANLYREWSHGTTRAPGLEISLGSWEWAKQIY